MAIIDKAKMPPRAKAQAAPEEIQLEVSEEMDEELPLEEGAEGADIQGMIQQLEAMGYIVTPPEGEGEIAPPVPVTGAA